MQIKSHHISLLIVAYSNPFCHNYAYMNNNYASVTTMLITVPLHFSAGCSKFYNSSSGTILSPLYPSKYPNNTICTYNITVAIGKRIYLKSTSISLSYGDSLELLVPAMGNKTEMNWITFPPYSYYSASNAVLIRFRSNRIHSYYGFRLDYFSSNGT